MSGYNNTFITDVIKIRFPVSQGAGPNEPLQNLVMHAVLLVVQNDFSYLRLSFPPQSCLVICRKNNQLKQHLRLHYSDTNGR